MANPKYIKAGKESDAVNTRSQYDLSVMKPFVRFGVGAIKVLAHTFIFIVKGAIKLRPDKPLDKPGKKIIKI